MYYVNGEYVKNEEAKLSILDLSILRGFAVFDYLRTYHGRPFHLHDHLQRLSYSCAQLGLRLPKTLIEIEDIVHAVQKSNNLAEASLKIMVTGGTSPDQFTPSDHTNLIVFGYPLAHYPVRFFRDGIKVITTRMGRCLPTSKTTQYTAAIVALQGAHEKDVHEALYLNSRNEILEATTSNFFAFKNGVLYTCGSDEILFGITREVILKLAAPQFPVELSSLSYDDIPEMEEAFITASNKEVMPVTQIDSMKIANGLVGPKTKLIMAGFRQYVMSPKWPDLNIARYS